MYEVIEEIINHSWQNNYTSDQQYIYYICGALIIIITVVLIDAILSLFRRFWR